MTKIFGLDFLTYFLKNKPLIYSKTMLCPETFYWKEANNREIESIINNHIWGLVDLPSRSKPLWYK